MRSPTICLLAVAATVGALSSAPASAQSLVGILKCTAEVTQAGQTEARDWKIACAYEPVKGQPQQFGGAINDPGVAPRAAGKAFLVWNVLAAAPDVKPDMLVGTYKEARAGANALVGGRNDSIALQPVTGPNQQDGINVAPKVSTVRLELPKV